MECVRTNTITFTFTEVKPSLEELEKLLSSIGVSVNEVEVVQEDFRDKLVHVKLRKTDKVDEKIEAILRKGRGRKLFTSSTGCTQQVWLSKNGAPISLVKLRNLPPEVGSTPLREELSEYGEVVELVWDRFKDGPFKGIRNGTRVAVMILEVHVPSFVFVDGFETVVSYPSQPRTCQLCDSTQHLRAKCPQRFARGSSEEADASLTDDEPAVSDAQAEEEEEKGAARAASEPPPQTTSADVTLPAADAPQADAPPPRGHTSPAKQDQQPAVRVQTTEAGGERRILEGAEGEREFGASLLDFTKVLSEAKGKNTKRGASGSPEGGGVQTRGKKNKKPALKRF